MKVFVMTDIEGVAGVVAHASHSYSDGKYYERSKLLLTGEVNAAAEGLFAAGATEVLVADGHGSGGISFEHIHSRVRLLHGRPITRRQLLDPVWDHDCAVMIGQHARAGVSKGNQSHTQSSRTVDWMHLNGREIGEIGQFALYAGLRDVPLIYLSGDEEGCREAEREVPGISTSTVKWGLGTNCEITLSSFASRELIRTDIARALAKHVKHPVSPAKLDGPYVLDVRWKTTALADEMEFNNGAERLDGQTTRFVSDSLIDVFCYRHNPSQRK
jgi:D-amino peptidase